MKLVYYIPLSIVIYFVVVFLVTTFITENLIDYEFKDDSLPDILHNNFKKFISMKTVNNILLVYLVYSIIRLITLNARYIGDALILISILFILRMITFSVTNIPPTYVLKKNKKLCKYKIFGKQIGFSFSKILNTCNDYMFSGHTVHVVTCLLFILYFSKNIIEKIILTCFALFLLFIIINSRMHYTSDIIVAVIITFLLFNYLRLKFKIT